MTKAAAGKHANKLCFRWYSQCDARLTYRKLLLDKLLAKTGESQALLHDVHGLCGVCILWYALNHLAHQVLHPVNLIVGIQFLHQDCYYVRRSLIILELQSTR